MRLLKIGRDASNDIVLHSDKVSSLHAEITLMDSGDIMLEDKGSHNGTFIQNRPITPGTPVSIRRGDAVRFADVELLWSQVPMPEDNSAYKAIYSIGSHLNNDIQVSGETVSRYHATIKVGKDNKVYIVDHSKNGTTVDGKKIPSNSPVRIKKSSSVVCGRVPVNLQNSPIQWPGNIGKTILIAAASILILVGIGFGISRFMCKGDYTDEELYNRYNHSVAMTLGIYHYNVTIGERLNELNAIAKKLGLDFYFPSKVILMRNQDGSLRVLNVSGYTSEQIVNEFRQLGILGTYTGTGFYISKDGQMITNLHIAKPWLFGNSAKMMEEYKEMLTIQLSQFSEYLVANKYPVGISAYISQLKVDGELDYIGLISQGMLFETDNAVKCRVLSAGSDTNKDVALIQTISRQLPSSDCTFLNLRDSMDISEEVLKVGQHIYTLGFPGGTNYQDNTNERGIQLYANGGSITQQDQEYYFGFNAPSTHGASGSPIFNKYGMLVGVLNAGIDETQGFNFGIKAKFVKELLDSPHKVD